MKTYLSYQLILGCSLMVYKSYSTNTNTLSTSDETEEIISKKYDEHEYRSAMNYSRYITIARPGDYPYHVLITLKSDDSVLCQGALVTPNWVITSGSCFKQYADFVNYIHVLAGLVSSRDLKVIIRDIDYGEYHWKFNPITNINDLALIKLVESINDDESLAKPIEMSDKWITRKHCTYSSFQSLPTTLPMFEEYRLFGLDLRLMDLTSCHGFPDKLGQVLRYFCAGIDDFQFDTTSNLNSNFTDFGSPLVCNNQLYGIKTNDGLFSTVADFKHWVNSVTGKGFWLNII